MMEIGLPKHATRVATMRSEFRERDRERERGIGEVQIEKAEGAGKV
jgi:hypothetical protein